MFIQYRKVRDDLMNSSWVTRYMSNTDVFENKFNVIKKNDICTELMIFKSLNLGISNIAVYFPKKDTVFSQIGWFTFEDFFRTLNLNNDSFEWFKSNVENRTSFNYFDISDLSAIPENTMVLTQKLELVEKPRALLLLFINKKYIHDSIESISSNLLTGYSISGSDGLIIERINSDETDENENCHISLNSDQYLFDYSFTYRIDSAGPSFEALSLIFMATIISLVLGTLIAYSLANAHYTPIKNIVRKIFSGVDASDKVDEHEYKLISQTFDNLFSEKKKMQLQVIMYQNAARSDMMKRLLAGYFQRDAVNFTMNDIGLNYTDDMYYLVILLGKDGQQRKAEYNSSGMFALYRTADKILGALNVSYQIVVSSEGNIITVVDFLSEIDTKNFITRFNEAFKSFKQDFSFCPKLFFGSLEKGIVGISKSYQKAKEEQTASIIKSNIVRMNLLMNKRLLYYYPTDWEIQLIHNIKIGDYDTAKKILDEIRLENEKRGYDEASMIKLTTAIIDTMIRILNELNMDVKDLKEQNQELMLLQETENVQLLWDFTYLVCSKICDRIEILNESDDSCTPRKIIDYINNNITDSNLSLKELADRFNLSVSSISKIFKDYMNINFYDYICRIRMDKAKEMLNENKYSLHKIAKAVGYENDYSFKRAFLRYEGIKPEEYKRIAVSQRP
jgi:AraC-like DNA-binding protein